VKEIGVMRKAEAFNNLYQALVVLIVLSILGLTIIASYAFGTSNVLFSTNLSSLYMISGAEVDWEKHFSVIKTTPSNHTPITYVDKSKIFSGEKEEIKGLLHMMGLEGKTQETQAFTNNANIDFTISSVWFDKVTYANPNNYQSIYHTNKIFMGEPRSFFHIYHNVINNKEISENYKNVTEEVRILLEKSGVRDLNKELDIAWRIYLAIIDAYTYDYELDKEFNSILGIVDKKTRCLGYAETFKLLCNMAGLECEIVFGYTEDGRHAWNIVKIDEQWFHVDATFADTGSSIYDMFGASDESISKTHTIDN
jgi:hypothetical protein